MKKKEKKQAKKIVLPKKITNNKASNKSKKIVAKPASAINLKKTISTKKAVSTKSGTKTETKKIAAKTLANSKIIAKKNDNNRVATNKPSPKSAVKSKTIAKSASRIDSKKILLKSVPKNEKKLPKSIVKGKIAEKKSIAKTKGVTKKSTPAKPIAKNKVLVKKTIVKPITATKKVSGNTPKKPILKTKINTKKSVVLPAPKQNKLVKKQALPTKDKVKPITTKNNVLGKKPSQLKKVINDKVLAKNIPLTNKKVVTKSTTKAIGTKTTLLKKAKVKTKASIPVSSKKEKNEIKILDENIKSKNTNTKKSATQVVPEPTKVPKAKKSNKETVRDEVIIENIVFEEEPKKTVLHKLEIKKNVPIKESKKNKQKALPPPPRELWRPDYSGNSPSIDKYTFVNANKPEPVKIESGNSTGKPVKFEIKKADAKKTAIKTELLRHCLEILNKSVAIAKKEMDDAQESANEEKGSTEEKFDSFRESMQAARDMFARQYSEGVNSVTLVNRINPTLEQNAVILGSVVRTDLMNYFVSASLGEITVGKEKFIAISIQTPLCQAIFGKKKGDTFKLMNKTYTIKEVF